MSENGTLRILDSMHSDSGAYTCRATTSGGQAEATVYLSVYEAPTAHVRPTELYVAESLNFNLSCDVNGVPKPDVMFLFFLIILFQI